MEESADMSLFANLAQRKLEAEVMDDPHLDADQHYRALRGLARINRLSDSGRLVWAPVAQVARALNAPTLRVLDIATGSGDVPQSLWRRARRKGLNLEILGLDVSSRAVDFARQRAEATGADVRFQTCDVFRDSLPQGFDVVMCSLFLHHLSREQAVELLRKMADAARHLLLVNDLERSQTGLLAAETVCRLTTTSRVVRIDGPRSVRAAFTVDEAGELAREAGLSNVRIVRRWPFRYVLTWKKTEAAGGR